MTNNVAKEIELVLETMTGAKLAELYNTTVPENKRISKFRDHKTAVERTLAAVLAFRDRTTFGYGIGELFKMIDEKTDNKKASKPQHSGKKSQFEGGIIKSNMHENPRREGTWGYKSFELIMAAGDEGISYEEFLAKGGRNKDLAWDWNHGFVSVDDESRELVYRSRDLPKYKNVLTDK